MNKIWKTTAVFLVACAIGLASCGIVTGDSGTTQAGLIAGGFGVAILLALSLKGE